MGVQFFGGKFFKCVDENGERVSVNVCIYDLISKFVCKTVHIFCIDREQSQRLHASQLHMVELENIVRQRGHSIFGFIPSRKSI